MSKNNFPWMIFVDWSILWGFYDATCDYNRDRCFIRRCSHTWTLQSQVEFRTTVYDHSCAYSVLDTRASMENRMHDVIGGIGGGGIDAFWLLSRGIRTVILTQGTKQRSSRIPRLISGWWVVGFVILVVARNERATLGTRSSRTNRSRGTSGVFVHGWHVKRCYYCGARHGFRPVMEML